MQKLSPAAIFLQVVLFLNIIVMSVTFRKREYGSDTIDFQVFVRLALLGVTLGACVFMYRLWIKRIVRLDNFFLVPLLALFFISSFYSPSFSYSFGCFISVLSAFLLLLCCLPVMGEERVLKTAISSMTFVSALSIVVYFVYPEMGHMKEWVGGVQVPGPRLSGVTGTANAIGFLSSVAVLMTSCCFIYYKRHHPFFYISFLINFAAMVMSNSRTSLFALILALGFGFFSKLTPARLAVMFFGIVAVILVLAMVDSDTLLGLIARSGSSAEIEEGNGRSYIWATVLKLIAEKPWTGWGYASSAFILPEHASEIGHTPPHAHNVFLQLAFSVGWFGAIFYLLLLAGKFTFSLRNHDNLKLTFISFIFISGLTEPSAFLDPANVATVLLAIIIASEYVNRNEIRHPSYQQRLS